MILTWLILAISSPSSANSLPILNVRPSAPRSVCCSCSSQVSSHLSGGGTKNRREKSMVDAARAEVSGIPDSDKGRKDSAVSMMKLLLAIISPMVADGLV